MAMMFGRFEIQSELSKSNTALIYKAMDTKADQVVALKTQSLGPLGDRAEAFVNTLIAEGESARDLASQNIVVLYGAGEIDGQFCAAMEYIQGNSIATMVARKEGFSIWDLLDITRQVGAGLEHAASLSVAHCSLEPAKIMVQWDGMVKILGYGISNMGLIEAESGNGLGRLMPYCSPEQIRGEAIDLRSNLFSLGTILYEMVAGRKAFDAADPVTLVNQIENEMPPSPMVSGKIHPGVSALIMKTLAKDPAERYQSARELIDDLEKCKETKRASTDGNKPVSAPSVTVSKAQRAAAAGKFVAASAGASAGTAAAAVQSPTVPNNIVAPRPAAAKTVVARPVTNGASSLAESGGAVAAAAAGAGTGVGTGAAHAYHTASNSAEDSCSKSEVSGDSNSGARMISEFETSAVGSIAQSPVFSSTVAEQETERPLANVPVDPLMSEPEAGSSGRSFSDLAEMPPLKESAFTPSIPEPAEPAQLLNQVYPKKEERPRVQPREIAGKALKEIATIPPRLMLYTMLGAVAVILVVAIAVFLHVHSEDDGATAAPQPTKAASSRTTSSSSQPVGQTAAAARIEKMVPLPSEDPLTLTVRPVEKRNSNRGKAPAPAPVPVVVPAQALIDSTPQGAPFQVDGKGDSSWVTPFTVTDLSPGRHIISATKAGYSSEIRSVEVAAGSKLNLLFHLSPVNALVVVNSTPAGASVFIDDKPTGRLTPAQFAVEKGSHTVVVRKEGYLDETVTADLGPAQNFQYAPVLKALGNTEDMRTVGKFNALFGRVAEGSAGKGSIVIRTQPKGAQVAINQRILDKNSPVGVVVSPGNYIVDITLTGYKPIHKVISVARGDRAAVIETMEPQ
jgi:serine/threonine protein kinase